MGKLPTQSLNELLDQTSLDDSFVLGYYGGGNYGDELLLEVLQHVFRRRNYRTISFLYQHPAKYHRHHQEFGYQPIDAAKKGSVIRTIFRRKNLIIGGGGLWGLDINTNVVLMSAMLFAARRLLGKNVYLVGVGYYHSTNRLGHFGAWLAGKAATRILARDEESYQNFARLNRATYLTEDIAFSLPEIQGDSLTEPKQLEAALAKLHGDVTVISLRRFRPNQANPYLDAVTAWLVLNPERPVILSLMEPREVDPEGYELLVELKKRRGAATIVDFRYNPIELYTFFVRHKDRLSFVGPQFHVQLIAHLAGVRFMPTVYDNKVAELLRSLDYRQTTSIKHITAEAIEGFVAKGEAS